MPEQKVWTVRALLDWTKEFLAQKTAAPATAAHTEAQILLADAWGCDRMRLFTHADEVPEDAVRTKFRDAVKKRAEGCPVAYLVGYREFFKLRFEVTPAVLIPRPETEHLIETARRIAQAGGVRRVLDVGTGSGCIAVTLAKHLKAAAVTAVDVSPDALAVARRNAEANGVADRVTFLEGDLFAPLPAADRYDLIASNPPYIDAADLPTLERDVRDHEPKLALDGGVGGLDVIRRLVPGAAGRLGPGGHLLVEIGVGQDAAVRDIAATAGLEVLPTVADLAKIPRVVVARRGSE